MSLPPPRTPVRAVARLGIATVGVGVVTGLAVLLLVAILHTLEHLVFGERHGTFLDALAQPAAWVPFVTVTAVGIVAAVGWYALRRWGRPITSIEQGVAGRRMPAWETLGDTVIQVTAVGMGASMGKEVAPRELSAMGASYLVRWFGLDKRWARILVASAAGAGLAAVYNVPLAGALFTLEILLVEFRPGTAIPALAVSGIATLVARPLVGDGHLYTMPVAPFSWSLLVAAVILGPLLGLAGTSFTAITKRLSGRRPTGWRILVVMPVVFAAVGALSIAFPSILGNGRALAQVGFDLAQPAWMLLILAAVKYLATAATLGAGAVGGTLQPSVAIGAALGAAAAVAWSLLWPGASPAALALVGAAAFLASTMRAPFTAIALVLEFTGTGFALLVPIVLAVMGALAASSLLHPAGLRRFLPIDPSRE